MSSDWWSSDLSGKNMLRALGPHVLSGSTECERYRTLCRRLNKGAHFGKDQKTQQSLASIGCSQRFKLLRYYLQSMPEAPVHFSLFKAFYEICFLPNHSATHNSELMESAAMRLKCKGTGVLTSEEVRRTDAVILLIKLLPKAHSQLLTYLLQFFWMTAMDDSPHSDPNNGRTLHEFARFFGSAVCAPRFEAASVSGGVEQEDQFAFIKSWGIADGWVLRDRCDKAEKEASVILHRVSVDLLQWLLSYWPKLYDWNNDSAAHVSCEEEASTGDRASRGEEVHGTAQSTRVSEFTADLARSVRIALHSSSFDTGEPRVKAMPLGPHDPRMH